ncbi:MAG TPA: hypothetical protein PKW73_13345 [Candidatus Obscuribacter sp.]|nr:hypothetical protein [Candidatus Obscuribacter sp.]
MSKGLVLCPIAWVVHCSGCALVKVCPARSILGDFEREPPATDSGGEAEEKSAPPESDADK